MKIILKWLGSRWADYRMKQMPEQRAKLYSQVFSTKAGEELLLYWIDTVVMATPRNLDSNEAIAHLAKVAFIEDICKFMNMGDHPAKYEMKQTQVAQQDPRFGGLNNGLAG